MPDSNGLSLWAERDATYQLKTTLQTFERAFFPLDERFSHTEVWMKELKKHGIETVEQLATYCRSELVSKNSKGKKNSKRSVAATDDDDDKDKENASNGTSSTTTTTTISLWKSPTTLRSLSAYLPSTLGFQCSRLAEEAVQRVESGFAKAAYVHRGSVRGEKWMVNLKDIDFTTGVEKEENTNNNDMNTRWRLDVDCAGYVRNVIKSVTGSDLLVSLSDRDYMRAKDFYTFFERLEYTVRDVDRVNPADDNNSDDPTAAAIMSLTNRDGRQLKFCRVDDLRTVIAGDIIVYRAKGGAAGGSVFTKKDCLKKALTAVKTAELYDAVDGETPVDQPVDINVAKLPEVKEWVDEVMVILSTVGIESIDQLRGDNAGENDEDNDDNLQAVISLLEREEKLSENTVSLLQEVLSSTNGNTGHIMWAAGCAEETSDETHIWRVPVYHSTGVGPKSKRGIQRAYKRFEYSPQYEKWTRGGPRDDVEGKHIEVVVGRMCV